MSLNSQVPAAASNYRTKVLNPVVNAQSTPSFEGVNTPTKNTFLPSMAGWFNGTSYANFSAGDADTLRTTTGTLDSNSDAEYYAFDEIVGPANGYFIITLDWNATVAPDIDLVPRWINSTGHLIAGLPVGTTEDGGDYYSGATPEYIRILVDLNSSQSVTLGAAVLPYTNGVIDYTLNATWINYDEWTVNTGWMTAPTTEIISPVAGEVCAPAMLNHVPQRGINLTYTYTAGTESAWNEESYLFEVSALEDSNAGGNFEFEVRLNNVTYGKSGADGQPLLIGLTIVDDYTLDIYSWYGDEMIATESLDFKVVGPSLVDTIITQGETSMNITQSFADAAITSPTSDGYEVDPAQGVKVVWYDYTADNWVNASMNLLANGYFTYTITGLAVGDASYFYYVLYDDWGFEYLTDYDLKSFSMDNTTTQISKITEDDSPAFIAPIVVFSFVGILTITRRRR